MCDGAASDAEEHDLGNRDARVLSDVHVGCSPEATSVCSVFFIFDRHESALPVCAVLHVCSWAILRPPLAASVLTPQYSLAARSVDIDERTGDLDPPRKRSRHDRAAGKAF